MSSLSRSITIVPCTIIGYGLLGLACSSSTGPARLAQETLNAISTGHATITTVLALHALRSSSLGLPAIEGNLTPRYLPDGNLDDAENSLVWEKSSLANAVTSLETGYLLYDTAAVILCQASKAPDSANLRGLIAHAARAKPDVLAHHVVLAAALLTLQWYIHQGRERGVLAIVVFILMNASTPLMHARWWWARRKGSRSLALDVAFAATFAACRFGTVAWVLRRYGQYHGIGPLEAFGNLRWYCKAGTGGLLAMNGLWWLVLVKGILMKRLRHRASS